MASIRREMLVDADPKDVWDAIRDYGAPHKRLAPGFLVDTRLEQGARVVTFANGLVARELIVDVDDDAQRLVWSVVGGRLDPRDLQSSSPRRCSRARRSGRRTSSAG